MSRSYCGVTAAFGYSTEMGFRGLGSRGRIGLQEAGTDIGGVPCRMAIACGRLRGVVRGEGWVGGGEETVD